MSPKKSDQPIDPVDPDATDTVVQPAAAAPAAAAPAESAAEPAAEPKPTKNRFGWLTSPKVAAATIITVLAVGSLGGAFALGRATAGDDHRGGPGFVVRYDDGQRGFGGPGFGGPGFGGPGFGGPGFNGQRMAPPVPGQVPDGTQEQAPSAPESGSTDSQAG